MDLLARPVCDFNAVKEGQVSVKEGEVVRILSIANGYATIKRNNSEQGLIPNYFLELADAPGETVSEEAFFNESPAKTSETERDLLLNASEYLQGPVKTTLCSFPPVLPPEGTLFPPDTPYFIGHLSEVIVRSGEPVELEVQVGSKHEFGLKWSYPNRERTDAIISAPSDRGQISLVLPHATRQDAGRYTVTVANGYGRVSTSCSVHVIEEPSPPKEFRYSVDSSKPRAIRLKWAPPDNKGGSKMMWYTVEYTRPGLDSYQEVIQGVRQCCIRISHLQASDYTFRVFAFNEFYRSPSTDCIVVESRSLEAELDRAHIRELEQKLKTSLLRKSFEECFVVGHVIGKGRTSVCRSLTCKVSNKEFAGKFFLLHDNDGLDTLRKEIAVLTKLNSPHTARYFGTAFFEDQLIVMMEKVPGSPILRYITKCGYLSEAIMQKFTSDLLNALVYLHDRRIAHLGIKPEEIIVETVENLPHVVLIDYGSAEEFEEGPNTCNLSIWQGGSFEFIAPEQLAHRPCCKSDIWSIAVLLFVLATGVSPFEDPDGSDEVTRRRILDGEIADCTDKLLQYTPDLIQFIAQVFVVEQKARLSARDCMEHGWINRVQSNELFMIDHIEDYIDKRRDRMRSSFLLHEV